MYGSRKGSQEIIATIQEGMDGGWVLSADSGDGEK